MAPLDELREEMERLRGKRLQLEALLKSPGWALLDEALLADIRARGLREMNTPISSLDGAFLSACARGEITGLRAAREMALQLIADLHLEINSITTEFEETERDETGE